MVEVTLEKLCKTYPNGVRAAREISLTAKDGEFLVLVGPSGCGKTTILRMVAGLESIDSGTLRIGGRTANDLEPKDRDVSMVFQNYALYPHMTVFDNMAFGLRARKTPQPEVNKRVGEVAKKLGLDDLLERKPSALSGGQRQRVALGRAIARRPTVFLMDEPLSNLDARLRVTMRRELALLHRELGTTTIYVTHDQVEAMTLGDRVCVMNEGEICQIGTPKEVYDHPADRFVAGFIGSPPMNLIDGELKSEGNEIRFVTREVSISISGNLDKAEPGKVRFGIRPEELSLVEGGVDAFSGTLEVLEDVGEARLLHVRVGDDLVIAKTSVREGIETGTSVNLLPEPGRCHLFDAGSGKNLSVQG